jgi:hypothetical protein
MRQSYSDLGKDFIGQTYDEYEHQVYEAALQ